MREDQIAGTGWRSHRTCTDSTCGGFCGRNHVIAPAVPVATPLRPRVSAGDEDDAA